MTKLADDRDIDPTKDLGIENNRGEHEKWVLVMVDWSSDGFWAFDGVMMSRDMVPISTGLLARHIAWCEQYENSGLADEDRDTTLFDIESFSNEGRVIAKAIKAELPDWTVFYHDENAHGIDLGQSDRDRATFHYEIFLDGKI